MTLPNDSVVATEALPNTPKTPPFRLMAAVDETRLLLFAEELSNCKAAALEGEDAPVATAQLVILMLETSANDPLAPVSVIAPPFTVRLPVLVLAAVAFQVGKVKALLCTTTETPWAAPPSEITPLIVFSFVLPFVPDNSSVMPAVVEPPVIEPPKLMVSVVELFVKAKMPAVVLEAGASTKGALNVARPAPVSVFWTVMEPPLDSVSEFLFVAPMVNAPVVPSMEMLPTLSFDTELATDPVKLSKKAVSVAEGGVLAPPVAVQLAAALQSEPEVPIHVAVPAFATTALEASPTRASAIRDDPAHEFEARMRAPWETMDVISGIFYEFHDFRGSGGF